MKDCVVREFVQASLLPRRARELSLATGRVIDLNFYYHGIFHYEGEGRNTLRILQIPTHMSTCVTKQRLTYPLILPTPPTCRNASAQAKPHLTPKPQQQPRTLEFQTITIPSELYSAPHQIAPCRPSSSAEITSPKKMSGHQNAAQPSLSL